MTKKDIEKLIIDYGNFRDKVKTFEELIPYENNLINKLNEAINYTRSCTEVCDCEFERIDSRRIQCVKCEMIQIRD